MPREDEFRTDYDPASSFLLGGGDLNARNRVLNQSERAADTDNITEGSDLGVVKVNTPPPDKAIGYLSFTNAAPSENNECPIDPATGRVTAQCFDLDLWLCDFIWFDNEIESWKLYELPENNHFVLDARGTANVDPDRGWGQVPAWIQGERVLALWNSQAGFFTPLNYGAEQVGSVEYMANGQEETSISGRLNFGSRTVVLTMDLNNRHVAGRDASFILPDPNNLKNYPIYREETQSNYHTIHGTTIFPIEHADRVSLRIGVPRDYPNEILATNWGFRLIPIGRGWQPREAADIIRFESSYSGSRKLNKLALVGESVNRFKDCPYSVADPDGQEVQFRFFNNDDPQTDQVWTCLCIYWCELFISDESTSSSSTSSSSSSSTGSSTGSSSTGSSTGSSGSSTGSSTGSTGSTSDSSSSYECIDVVTSIMCNEDGVVTEVCTRELCVPKGDLGEEECGACEGADVSDGAGGDGGDNTSSSSSSNSSSYSRTDGFGGPETDVVGGGPP